MRRSFHKLSKVGSPNQESGDETEDEPLPNSLAASRDLGLSSDVAYEESAEDDGFVPVKTKGRKRKSLFSGMRHLFMQF